ncbi:MAG: hypothetical protein ACI8QZ_003251 [Chlamydiales bacterium]|jgi:hypothetical protein
MWGPILAGNADANSSVRPDFDNLSRSDPAQINEESRLNSHELVEAIQGKVLQHQAKRG